MFCLSRGFRWFFIIFFGFLSPSFVPYISRSGSHLSFRILYSPKAVWAARRRCHRCCRPKNENKFYFEIQFFLWAWLSSLSQHKRERSQFILSTSSPLSSSSFKLKNSVEIDENTHTTRHLAARKEGESRWTQHTIYELLDMGLCCFFCSANAESVGVPAAMTAQRQTRKFPKRKRKTMVK